MYIHSYIHAYIYVHAQTHKHAHTHTHTHRCIMYIYKYIYNTTTINRSTSGGTHEQHMSNTLATHYQHITRSTSGWFSLCVGVQCNVRVRGVVQKRPTIEAKETYYRGKRDLRAVQRPSSWCGALPALRGQHSA